jgi:hypothetical protein
LDDEIELGGWEIRRNDVSLSIFDLDWTLLAPSDASATTSAESTAEPQAATVAGFGLRAPPGDAESWTACT